MPPKTFKCCVCGEEVSKRQSYNTSSGRACRSHDEAQEAHVLNEEDRRRQAGERKIEKKNRHKNRDDFYPSQTPEDREFKKMASSARVCHFCKKEGMTLQDVFLASALAIHEARDQKDISFIDLMKGISDGQKTIAPNTIISVKIPKRFEVRINKILFSLVQVGIIDSLQACGECVKKYKLEMTDKLREYLENPPKINVKQALMLSAVMSPEFDRILAEKKMLLPSIGTR